MALYNYGNNPANVWNSQNNISIGGQTEFAFMWRGSFPAAFSNELRRLAAISQNFSGGIQASYAGGIQAHIRTSAVNSNRTAVSSITPGQEYIVFALLTGGRLKIYVNGVLELDEERSGTTMTTNDKFVVEGFSTEGLDQTHVAAAYWLGVAPSETDIQAYPSKNLTDFDTPPTDGYLYQGDGGIVSSINSLSSTNPLIQITGATEGANAPVADGSVPSTESVTLTEIDGRSVTGSSVYGVKAVINGSQSPAVTVSGTYTGAIPPEGVRIRTGTNAYRNVQSLVIDEENSEWAGTIILSIGEGLEYGDVNSQDTEVIPHICCGRVFYGLGQSNAAGKYGTDPGQVMPSALPAGGVVYKSNHSGVFTRNPAPGLDYHMTYSLALLSRQIGEPIIYINAAIGATAIQTWLTGGSSYSTATANLTDAGMLNPATGANVIWWQGEADTGMAAATYRNHLLQVKEDWGSVAGTSQWFVLPIINIASVYRGTIDAIYLSDDMHLGAMMFDIKNGLDNIHPTDPQEAQIIGGRLSQSLLSYYTSRYDITPALWDVTLTSQLNITVDNAPDGTYETTLTADGRVVFSGPLSYVDQVAPVSVPTLAGTEITGHVVSGSDGAVIVSVTE